MAEYDVFTTIAKTVAMLALVLGALAVFLYLLKRWTATRQALQGKGIIRPVSSFYFSPKERIEVVDIQGERFLLAIGSGGISLLAKLSGDLPLFDSKPEASKRTTR